MVIKEERGPEERGSMAEPDQSPMANTPGLEDLFVEPQRAQHKSVIEQMISLLPTASDFIPKSFLNSDAERHMYLRMFAAHNAVAEGKVDIAVMTYLDMNLRVAVKGRGRSEVVEMVTKERPSGNVGFGPGNRRRFQPQEGGSA
tara:strand:+ start:2064 stop:2495 length:432 start_codon:yes stop_codon:yes gene_type:complete